MPAIEYEPTQQSEHQQDVEAHPETPTIPEQVEKATGAQVIPTQPASVVDDVTGQVLAQPVVTDPSRVKNIPYSAAKVESMANSKDFSKSSTWLGVQVKRVIKMAILRGKQIIFGNE